MLNATGAAEAHESAYRALIGLGHAELSEFAHRLTVPEGDAVRILRWLERHGLAARSTVRPGRWVAAPPAVPGGALLARQRRGPEGAADRLTEKRRADDNREPAERDRIEVVTGAQPVALRLQGLRLAARTEIRTLTSGAPGAVAGSDSTGPRTDGAPGRHVRQRSVIERGLPPGTDGPRGAAPAPGRDEQVRMADRVPAELTIADDSLAMLPLPRPDGSEPAALVVRGEGLLAPLAGLFEEVWRRAVPLRPGPPSPADEAPQEGPDGTDLRILSLLLAGSTDASVAKQLDLGLRTVQRRVKRLMELVEVSTRLQLGWHAYERGWVTR